MQIVQQIHDVRSENGAIKAYRTPMFTDKDRDVNIASFRRAARRSWIQWGVTNKGYYEATSRNLDYKTLVEKTRAQIEQEHPGTEINRRVLRNAMLRDCTNIAEAIAMSIPSGPKRERQVAALRNFDHNQAARADDVNYKLRALVSTFGETRFAEYLDVVTKGVNQHFLCRSRICRSFFPSDCWLQAYNHNGSALVPKPLAAPMPNVLAAVLADTGQE